MHNSASIAALAALPGFDPTPMVEMIGEDYYIKLLRLFCGDMEKILLASRAGSALASPADCSRYVHRIKGSASIVGAKALEAVARDLEQGLASGETRDVQPLLSALADTLSSATAILSD